MLLSSSAFASATDGGNDKKVIVEGFKLELSTAMRSGSYVKSAYLVEDRILDDGTIVMKYSESPLRYGYMLEMIMYVDKVSDNIYSIRVQAYTGAAMVLIKSFSATLDYGNGDLVYGSGVNNPPYIDGCSTLSTITYPNRVYSSGTYYIEIVSYRLIICEYINTDNTEEAGLTLYATKLVVG